jgi:hypothetical protein
LSSMSLESKKIEQHAGLRHLSSKQSDGSIMALKKHNGTSSCVGVRT